jgi:CRP-like cAMP-binding protein
VTHATEELLMSIHSVARNLLLARLPNSEYERLTDRMRPVTLDFRQILYQTRAPIEYVYFLSRGAASAMTVMENGSAIEVATIGNEGVVGHSILFSCNESTNEIIMQVGGEGLRIDADVFRQEADHDGPLRRLMLSYNAAYSIQVSQSVGCNGLHNVQQRCCRWLLITLDRMESNVVPLTHEFLSIMLGVRRASVTDVLRPLHEQGLVNNSRGAITIVDRHGLEKLACECYRRVKDEFERILADWDSAKR